MTGRHGPTFPTVVFSSPSFQVPSPDDPARSFWVWFRSSPTVLSQQRSRQMLRSGVGHRPPLARLVMVGPHDPTLVSAARRRSNKYPALKTRFCSRPKAAAPATQARDTFLPTSAIKIPTRRGRKKKTKTVPTPKNIKFLGIRSKPGFLVPPLIQISAPANT